MNLGPHRMISSSRAMKSTRLYQSGIEFTFVGLPVFARSFLGLLLALALAGPALAGEPDTLQVRALDEVVVSGSVKETNELESLPTAVSVVSPRQLQEGRVESLPALSAFVPNFFIPSYGAKVSTPIYIRGIGARLGPQTVGLYVDNVPSFNSSAFDFEFQDIQRVEVLRGAQGTLYGRNAVGGIVNIYTLSPLTYQGTRLAVGGGSHGQLSVKASHYSRLGDNFGASIAGYYKRDDGYFMNSYTGQKMDGSENAGVRLKLEWQVSTDFKAMLFGNYDRVSGGAFPYMQIDSTAACFNEPSSYDRHLLTGGLSLNYAGNGFSIHSTTGFQYLEDDMWMDQDYSPRPIFSLRQQQEQRSFSQEFTVKSDFQGRYRWVVGLFGFVDNREVDTPVTLEKGMVEVLQRSLDAMMKRMGAPLRLVYASDRIALPGVYFKPSCGAALFHQSTLEDIFGVEGLSATAGIRLDYERTGLDYRTESNGADVYIQFQPPLPMAPILVEGDTLLTGSARKVFWEVLPKFALKYRLSPTTSLYLSASKGYKTGGYNEQVFSEVLQFALAESLMRNVFRQIPSGVISPMPNMETKLVGGTAPATGMPPTVGTPSASMKPPMGGAIPTVEEQVSFAPESSWTYEIGGRHEVPDRSLSFSGALFYSRVDNLQLTKLVSEGTAGRTITNAGQSESKGLEVSLRYLPYENLSLFVEYGLADARFVKYETRQVIGGDTLRDFAGNRVPFAPKHTLSLGASYLYVLPSGSMVDRVMANVQYSGVGRIYWTESNLDSEGNVLYQPFYGLTKARLVAQKRAFALELWMENLFNTQYHAFLFEQNDLVTGKTNHFVQRGYPTRFGATLRYTFDR
ncbi:MAG TPA: TonB-dependent receptor [Bacteroidales bacterium]|nr:TonB-dependent receptor [Bacteroidales bacterium]